MPENPKTDVLLSGGWDSSVTTAIANQTHRLALLHASIPVTYVPFRNAHLLSAAVSWAEVIGATAILIGAVAEDSSGYPDCRPEYYHAFAELIG